MTAVPQARAVINAGMDRRSLGSIHHDGLAAWVAHPGCDDER